MTRQRNYWYRIRWVEDSFSMWEDWSRNDEGFVAKMVKDPYVRCLEFKTQPDSPQVCKYYERLARRR